MSNDTTEATPVILTPITDGIRYGDHNVTETRYLLERQCEEFERALAAKSAELSGLTQDYADSDKEIVTLKAQLSALKVERDALKRSLNEEYNHGAELDAALTAESRQRANGMPSRKNSKTQSGVKP